MEGPHDDPFNVQYWSTRWSEKRIGFHKTIVNQSLITYIGRVTNQHDLTSEPLSDPKRWAENFNRTWFVPLCGKTLDIPYLLSQGFKVFGVEAIKQAIEELKQEHGDLELVFDEKNNLYTGADGRLTIFVGDLFQCPVEEYGPFDFIWDRGSFIAVEYPHREPYSALMQRVLKGQSFSYLLETVQYDKEKFEGPPRSVSDEDLETYFGSWAKTELLSVLPVPEGNIISTKLQGEGVVRVFLITPKSKSK